MLLLLLPPHNQFNSYHCYYCWYYYYYYHHHQDKREYRTAKRSWSLFDFGVIPELLSTQLTKRLLTTSSDGRTPFTTVDNTCGVTMIGLC